MPQSRRVYPNSSHDYIHPEWLPQVIFWVASCLTIRKYYAISTKIIFLSLWNKANEALTTLKFPDLKVQSSSFYFIFTIFIAQYCIALYKCVHSIMTIGGLLGMLVSFK